MPRTDPNRRKHVPADARPAERREGTRHARRAAKAEAGSFAEVTEAFADLMVAANHLAEVIEEPVAVRREAAADYQRARQAMQATADRHTANRKGP